MINKRKLWFMAIIISLVSVVMAQDNSCPAIVETILETVQDACDGLGRNQVCYGNNRVTALNFDDTPVDSFEAVGDTAEVFNIASLVTTPFNEGTDTWGIATMKLQADLPDTLPGQNVTFVVFGDTELTNEIVPEDQIESSLSATSTGRINVRSGPGTDFSIVDTLTTGEEITLVGRSASGDWVQIELDEGTGWVFLPLLHMDGNAGLLAVVNEEDSGALTAPMQAFSLQTGIGATRCHDVPPDGILVQAPQETIVHFNINGVEVEVGSTAFINADNDELNINTFDGSVNVTSSGETQAVKPGYRVNASTDTPPTEPETYDYEALASLPIELLPDAVGIPIPISSNSDWVDTGIEVSEGDTFVLRASGIVNFWDICETQKFEMGQPDLDCSSLILSPDGGIPLNLDGDIIEIDMSRFPVPEATPHSLVAQIGGSAFFVGTGGTFTAQNSGNLQFRVNDVDKNNIGAFVVTVRLVNEE